MRLGFALSLLIACVVFLHRPLVAQDRPREAALESFVHQVAELWAEADVAALVDLLPHEDPIVLDAGSGTESANPRHAAAALRALFAEHESVAAAPVRVTVSSTSPTRGFGELAWIYRLRGAPAEQSRTIYVAVIHEEGEWKVTELRLLP